MQVPPPMVSPRCADFMAFFIGFSLTLPFGLPDAMLADIIDYDELRTGLRNEGMYTVVETK